MEKPQKPKKPKKPKLHHLSKNVIEYLSICNDGVPRTKDNMPPYIDELPENPTDMERRAYEFWVTDADGAREDINFSQLLEWSNRTGITDFSIRAFSEDKYSASLGLVVRKTLPDETLEALARENATMEADYKAKLADYEVAKEKYAAEKVLYQIFKAEEKLEKLKGGSRG